MCIEKHGIGLNMRLATCMFQSYKCFKTEFRNLCKMVPFLISYHKCKYVLYTYHQVLSLQLMYSTIPGLLQAQVLALIIELSSRFVKIKVCMTMIGVSLSEPHTYQYYEKITCTCAYVCTYVPYFLPGPRTPGVKTRLAFNRDWHL